jgi:hypothetical protein
MNVNELVQELKRNNIDPKYYSLNLSNPQPGQRVLEKSGQFTWRVYDYIADWRDAYKTDPMMFASEDEACRYFLKWNIESPPNR